MIRAIVIAIAALLALAGCSSAGDTESAASESTGYRYSEWLNHWEGSSSACEGARFPDAGVVYEQREERWVDQNMNGHRIAYQGTVISGDAGAMRGHPSYEPSEGEYQWGSTPRPRLAELATDPAALLEQLIDDYKSRDWAPGHPTDEQVTHDVVYDALLVLANADTTPALRTALFEAIALTPGATPVPGATDPSGRTGKAVRVPLRYEGVERVFTLIFHQASSELLFWSLTTSDPCASNQRHMIRHAGHVDKIGDRA